MVKPNGKQSSKQPGSGGGGENQASKNNKNKKSKNNSNNDNNNNNSNSTNTATNNSTNTATNKQTPQKSSNYKRTESQNTPVRYHPHLSLKECLRYYNEQQQQQQQQDDNTAAIGTPQQQQKLPRFLRGKFRALPGNNSSIPSFVTCDRGMYTSDVMIADTMARNRAMNGDFVFVEVLGPVKESDEGEKESKENSETIIQPQLVLVRDDEAGDEIVVQTMSDMNLSEEGEDNNNNNQATKTWQDDSIQMDLWNPKVSIPRIERGNASSKENKQPQYKGKVIAIVPPHRYGSDLSGEDGGDEAPQRRIVGSLKVLPSGTTLLIPLNKTLPHFLCPADFGKTIQQQETATSNTKAGENSKNDVERILFKATYTYGDWKETHNWPPCKNVERVGESCLVEDEIQALLMDFDVDHGDHPPHVLAAVERAVKSGLYHDEETGNMGWKPTPDMCKGRRDYRNQRIFTIDPTTAKDLDDALHVTLLPDRNQVEVGVHIADVSYFIHHNTAVDQEAQRRATTVYLVDRTIPMLPRPLCEVACSLNENVERLAFSCVWRMNLDGSLPKDDEIWYGRTVIRSCARLDYATAQNIIDGSVGTDWENIDEAVWPTSRRPAGMHTMAQVVDDVLLLHKVAVARRKARFDNGALALNGTKLTFQLDKDGQTPLLAAPYPIRDSNRLVEEYMLLANFNVAQRLITHAEGGRAVLRQHVEPLEEGLDKVADVAKAAMGFEIDIRTSQTLHDSLHRLRQECEDPLVLSCVTQMLMAPMQPADYFAAGTTSRELWKHFALNIPYYTHFTSPIRRYPDIMVHRLLQATLDGKSASYPLSSMEINKICQHCNDKRMASKNAQERCDRVFLALYLRNHPMRGEMGVVLSVGISSFTVFCPSIGVSTLLYLEEHKDVVTWDARVELGSLLASGAGSPVITLRNKSFITWKSLEIRIFAKIKVTIYCRDKPPIDVKLRLEGPWQV